MVQYSSGNDSDTKRKAKFDIAGFFTSGWSHLVRLMSANVLFIVFNIPSIVICFLLSFLFLPVLIPAFDWESFVYIQTSEGKALFSSELYFLLVIFFITFLLSGLLVCIGPFQAGFTQVYRDIRNGTSFSLFGSFKNGLKYWKKSLGAMFIGIVISSIFMLAISFYLNFVSGIGIVIGAVFIVLLVFFILIQNYVYNLIVSTDLKLGKIYKNAILFVLIRFIPSILLSLVVVLSYYLIPFVLLMSASYLTLGIFVFLYSFLVISWVQYLLSYYSGVLIDRYVLPEDISSENEEKTNEFELELKDSKDKNCPETSSEDISDV